MLTIKIITKKKIHAMQCTIIHISLKNYIVRVTNTQRRQNVMIIINYTVYIETNDEDVVATGAVYRRNRLKHIAYII